MKLSAFIKMRFKYFMFWSKNVYDFAKLRLNYLFSKCMNIYRLCVYKRV